MTVRRLQNASVGAVSLRNPGLHALSQRSIVAHNANHCPEAVSSALTDRHSTDAVSRHTSIDGVGNGEARIHEWCHTLPAADLVVFREVLVQMGFQELVADESLAAIVALELNALVEFSDGNDVKLFQKVWRVLQDA